MIKNRDLDEMDLLWIFAIKDGTIDSHYKEYYGGGSTKPTKEVLVDITSSILDKSNGWSEAINKLLFDRLLFTMCFAGDSYDNFRVATNAVIWVAIENFLKYRKTSWIQEYFGENWENIIAEERKKEWRIKDETGGRK